MCEVRSRPVAVTDLLTLCSILPEEKLEKKVYLKQKSTMILFAISIEIIAIFLVSFTFFQSKFFPFYPQGLQPEREAPAEYRHKAGLFVGGRNWESSLILARAARESLKAITEVHCQIPLCFSNLLGAWRLACVRGYRHHNHEAQQHLTVCVCVCVCAVSYTHLTLPTRR